MNCNLNLFNYDKNTCSESIFRMRGSGSAVPKKATGKYIYTLEQIASANAIQYSENILLIHDYNSPNDALNLQKQLLQIQNDAELSYSFAYTQNVNMSLYDASNNPNGNVKIISVKQKIDSLGDDLQYRTDYVPYSGSDLLVSNYGVVIICTKRLPFYDTLTGQTIDIDEYDRNFGFNLQNYINAGGNVIAASNIWQNKAIPNFAYANVPFVHKDDYVYAPKDLTRITFLNQHPILKQCSPNVAFNPPVGLQSIVTNIVPLPDATVVATTTDGVPFIATYRAPLTGSKSVAINAYIFSVSGQGQNNLELAKIVYNSIYWCLKYNI